MGVSKITKVSVILPRSHVPNAMEQLSKFDYFHAAQPDSSTYDELLTDYSKRSFKIYVQISDIIKERNRYKLKRNIILRIGIGGVVSLFIIIKH